MATYFVQTIIPLSFGCSGCGMLLAFLQGRKASTRVCSIFLFAQCLSLIASVVSCYGQQVRITSGLHFGGLAALEGTLDPLSSLFLVLLGVVGCTVAIFSPGYLEHLKDRFHAGFYWLSLLTFVSSMALVLLSNNAVAFLVFWELMALSSIALVLSNYTSQQARTAALIYLGATRISTSLLLTGFLWMHALTASWSFVDWRSSRPEFIAPFIVIFIGLCIKAGVWPFHQWLPYAHPEAPAPVSALMSGVMVKVAIYAMLRLLGTAQLQLQPIAYAAIALGVVSSFWGILFALMESDLKRLLAYSTVENVGLLILSIGVMLLAKSLGLTLVGSMAVGAVLLHCVNHGTYKSLLFLSAGSVDAAAHSRDLNHLGGLSKGMKWSLAFFLVGSMAICALPPLNGFSSKWLMYQTIFQFAICERAPLSRAAALGVIGLLSMVGAFSVASFSKAFGLGFLGRARSRSAEAAVELSRGTVLAQLTLAIPCVVLGLIAPTILRAMIPIESSIIPGFQAAAIFTIPLPQLFVALGLLLFLAYTFICAGNNTRVRHYLTWDCGYGPLPARALIGPASYSRTLADLFRPILQYKISNQIEGRDRRHFPESITVEAKTISSIGNLLYSPAMRAVDTAGRWLIKLQTGSIHVHLLYVFATLLILVLVGTRL